MLEAKSVKTEPEAENITSTKHDELKVGEMHEPLLDNKDMCALMCIICASLITYLLFDKGVVAVRGGLITYVLVILLLVNVIADLLIWVTQKIVRACYVRAKRKADN